jgi:MFS transporter, YNFM family, putative membrane transport protein
VGFLGMGGFITIFNYLGFRLSAAPYGLSHAVIASIFLSYIVGTASSAWAGRLADRIGRRKVLWFMILTMGTGLALMAFAPLAVIITGVIVLTFGFFGAHAVASGWVGRRALGARAQASAMYLFFYYMGSSVIGTLGGWLWNHYAWRGVTVLAGAVIGIALAIAIRLYFLPPLPVPEDGVKATSVAAA